VKDFDNWNNLKKDLDRKENFPYPRPREIWWCSIGVNVGVEIDGKNDNFERPVLVLRAYNKEMLKIVPLTTKEKLLPYYFKIERGTLTSYAVMSQVRVISSRRMIRKISKITVEEFKKLRDAVQEIG